MNKENKVQETTEIINYWFRDNKLNQHYAAQSESNTYLSIIICKLNCRGHSGSGLNRVRVDADGVFLWTYANGSFDRVEIKLADPQFFIKLEALLSEKCIPRRTKSNKTYRQL